MDIQEVLRNSYRNFHARGLDYLCLHRSPDLTVKVYFFDGQESQLAHLPEIVMPHDHRYSFDTTVLRGRVTNMLYEEGKEGDTYQRFAWDTPLLGGAGFKHQRETRIGTREMNTYGRGSRWASRHDDIHTLRIHEQGTILILRQFEDCVPIGTPTVCYTRGEDPKAPSLSGLYEEMEEADAMRRIQQVREAISGTYNVLFPGLHDMLASPELTGSFGVL